MNFKNSLMRLFIIGLEIILCQSTIFLPSNYFGAYQVRLQILNDNPNQIFTFPNNQKIKDIKNLGLVLSGYDFGNMFNVEYNASISIDNQSQTFQIILFREKGTKIYYLNYFIVMINLQGSKFIHIMQTTLLNNRDFSFQLVNSTTSKSIQGPYYYNSSISKIKIIPMLRSIKTNSSNIYAYFNLISVRYINDTNFIEVRIENQYGKLKEITLSLIIYHQTFALNNRPSLYSTYLDSFSYLDSSTKKSNIGQLSNRNFEIDRLFGPSFEPQCVIGYQKYILQSKLRQIMTFNMSHNGFTRSMASEKYMLAYSYFCLVDISCQSNNMVFYPLIQRCQPICKISNCNICSSSTSCIQCNEGYFVNQLYTCSNCPQNCKLCNNSKQCKTCNDFFYLSGSNCLSCPTFCIRCDAFVCHSCIQGFIQSSQSCVKCDSIYSGCILCKYYGFCDKCVEPLIFNGNLRRCALCSESMIGCAKCDVINNCLTCMDGYYLFRFDKCQPCHYQISSCCNFYIQYCTTCTSKTICATCRSMYYFNGSKCASCNTHDIHCSQCDSFSCKDCIQGFYLLNGTSKCLPCNQSIQNCASCSIQLNCKKCNANFLLIQNSCLNCKVWPLNNDYFINQQKQCHLCDHATKNCIKCKEDSRCIQCQQLYFLLDDKCELCKNYLTNCLSCIYQQKCQLCESGYYLSYLDNRKTCKKCSDKIENCRECFEIAQLFSNKTYMNCKICEPQYIQELGKCKPCLQHIPNCLSCTNKGCLHCENQFYVSFQKCLTCPQILQGCITCKSSSQCLKCSKQYFLQYYECTKCSQLIQNCENCLFYNITSTFICQKCNDGYYFDGFTCKSCSLKFNLCSSCNLNGCQSCIAGNYVNQNGLCNHCSLILAGCSHCSSQLKCLICQQNYFLQSDLNKCKSCNDFIKGCLQCTKIKQNYNCTKCSKGYGIYINNLNSLSICLACNTTLPFCQICTAFHKCDKCIDSYFINLNGKCSQCSVFIKNCNICSNSSRCTVCQKSFILAEDGSCKYCNLFSFGQHLINNIFEPACLACNLQNNVLICDKCIDGFYFNLSGSKCQKCDRLIQNCHLCSAISICIKCLPTFYLSNDNKRCVFCEIKDCSQCRSNVCLKCLPGSYLTESNICKKCEIRSFGCKTCNNINCQTCIDGYYLQDEICKPCSVSIPNCILCANHQTCLLKYQPFIQIQSPYLKPIAIIFSSLFILLLAGLLIWFIYFQKPIADEFQEEIKIQTDRRMHAQQVYSNEIALQEGKICQSCLKSDSQIMSLQLLCKECDEILHRGNNHKIKKSLSKNINTQLTKQDNLINDQQKLIIDKNNIQNQAILQNKKNSQNVLNIENSQFKKQKTNRSTRFQSSNKKSSSINYRQMF